MLMEYITKLFDNDYFCFITAMIIAIWAVYEIIGLIRRILL
jgi:hypothetical protein